MSRWLRSDAFLTVVPSFSLKMPQPNRLVQALPVVLPNSQNPVGIRTLQHRPLSPLAELFIEHVRTITKPLVQGN